MCPAAFVRNGRWRSTGGSRPRGRRGIASGSADYRVARPQGRLVTYNLPMLARLGARLADFSERFFPDAFVFALAAIAVVFLGGLGTGVPAVKMATEFRHGFWC